MSISLILEEWDINLTQSEQKTFFRFLGFYLGSSLVLMLLIAFFYYQNEKRLYTDLTKSKLQNIVSSISNEVIFSHMRGFPFDKEKYLSDKNFEIAFYDNQKEKIFGTLNESVDFSKSVHFENQSFLLVDSSTVGHLGIDYIVIKDNSLWNKLKELKINIIMFFLIIYALIALSGFYLAKLFLKPIRMERERINNFIKDTTHELNTPISALLMSTESETLSKKQVERIRLSASRISEIYKDLTYIFLQDYEQHHNIQLYSLKSLIEEQLSYFEPLIQKKRITITSHIEEYNYEIDKDDFIRLFNNLLGNAIKYNNMNGNINITLNDKTLCIEDSGIGISQEKLKDIFKRYIRATNVQGGFGIGLHIVSHICKRYNISIDVTSEQNVGTTFKLSF